jgi:hypothetical protein
MAEPQQSAVDLYDWLDTWCDGEPSTLAERILVHDAPDDQVIAMALDWPRLDYELDVLPAGKPSLSTLSETLRAELFTEPEGEYGEIEVEQEYWRRPAGFVGHGWRGA